MRGIKIGKVRLATGFVFGVLLIILSIVVLTCFKVNANGSNSCSVTDEKIYFTDYTVKEGDSIWSIAKEYIDYNHYSCIGDYIAEIRAYNDIYGDYIAEGSIIILTYYR